nr:MAG TPA: hypothetical protein [Caudoviricetes sp.]
MRTSNYIPERKVPSKRPPEANKPSHISRPIFTGLVMREGFLFLWKSGRSL